MDRNGGFDDFFQACLPRARGVAGRILTTPSDVDDAVAEAFARALASWRKVGPLPYRDAWLLRVTANVAVDMTRRRRPPLGDAYDSRTEAIEQTSSVLDRIALAAALGALAPKQRDVVALHYLAGLSIEQVADALHVSVNTVKTHNARALEALRVRLGVTEGQLDGRAV